MNSVLFIVLLSLFDRQISAQTFADRRPFDCDADAANAIRTGEYSFQFQGLFLFIYLKDYLFLFKRPSLEVHDKQVSLIVKKPYFMRVDGRLYQGVKGVLDLNHEKIYSVRVSQTGFKCHLMSFKGLPTEVNETGCDSRYLNTTGLLVAGDTFFYRYIREPGGKYQAKKEGVLDVFLKYRKKQLLFESMDSSSRFEKVIKMNYTVTRAAVDLKYDYKLYEISEEPGRIRMVHVRQMILERSEKNKVIQFKIGSVYQMRLDDYLGCTRKLESYDQIKGIYYNDGTFYLVLAQFYVKFEAYLIDDRFEGIEEGALYENRTAYRSNEEQLPKIKFDQERKWVKMLEGANKLSFHSEQVYDVIYSGEMIELKQSDSFDFLGCATQTLEVDGQVFCFTERHYRKMKLTDKRLEIPEDSKAFAIAGMFSEVKDFSYEEQNLKFIFTYLEDKFVFMTDKYYFIVEYSMISVGDDGKLTIRYQHESQLDYQENCLMEKCTTPRRPRAKKNSYLLSVIVITLSTVALTLLVYYFTHRRAPKPRIKRALGS